FRRALSTALQDRFPVPPHVVEAILGHISGHKAGVAGTYNKAAYLDDRRRALERWGAHIMELVQGTPRKAKAVHLKQRRKRYKHGPPERINAGRSPNLSDGWAPWPRLIDHLPENLSTWKW